MKFSSRYFLALAWSLLVFGSLWNVESAEFADEFDSVELENRRALRGNWGFAGGVAHCRQDDDLYKKYRDHGPIIFFDLEFTDCEVSYRFKPDACKTVVFTLNGRSGHVFRFVISEQWMGIRLFPKDGEKKSISGGRSSDIVLRDGEWATVKVIVKGDTAAVQIGDAAPVSVTHETLAASKNNLSIGFSFGALSIADWKVSYGKEEE